MKNGKYYIINMKKLCNKWNEILAFDSRLQAINTVVFDF